MLVDDMHTPLLRRGALSFTILNKATVLDHVLSNVVIIDSAALTVFSPLAFRASFNGSWFSAICKPTKCSVGKFFLHSRHLLVCAFA